MINYGTIYTLPFKSIKEISYLIEIQKENYEGESIELVGSGDSPFSVSIEDEDFLYIPTRFSTATIRIVGGDYLQSLYSTGYQQYRVVFKKEKDIIWTGFIKPELYTQDYTSTKFQLEIECTSAMGVLEYINYKQKNDNRRSFVTLWDLLSYIIIESRGCYSSIFIPHVYARSAESLLSDANVLEEMSISEQNFFDEDNNPMKLREVLEEICKFLNWTCTDWNGDLYFIDIDHKSEYHKYNADLLSHSKSYPNKLDVSNIGFSGYEHSLDILPGYNKVTIKCSNYPVGNIFSQDEDYDQLDVIQRPSDIYDENKVCHRMYLAPKSTGMEQFTLNPEGKFTKLIDLKSYNGDLNSLYGAFPMRYCNYEINDGKPSINDYSYTDVIRVRLKPSPGGDTPLLDSYEDVARVKGVCAIYADGAITINGLAKVLYNSELSPLKTDYRYSTKEIAVSIRIGSVYYDPSIGWGGGGFSFKLPMKKEPNDEYLKIQNSKTLDMPYTGASGYIIPIDKTLIGDFEFIIYTRDSNYDANEVGSLLKDFKIEYIKADIEENGSDSNSDRIYENVINENYINELDEIEFKISSYNNDGACYSKVVLGNDYLKDNLYSSIGNSLVRLEELLIRRIINQYGATKIKLTRILKNSGFITPISILADNHMKGMDFMITGGELDFANEQFICKMIES